MNRETKKENQKARGKSVARLSPGCLRKSRTKTKESFMKKLIGILMLLLLLAPWGLARAQPAVIVAALDLTANYQSQAEAKKIIAGVISGLRSGDVFHLQTILERSYGPQGSVLRIQIPEPVAKPQNQYDRHGWIRYRQSLRSIRQAKINAIRKLAALKPTAAVKRDLYGALLAAEEKFNSESANAKRFLMIASNMRPSWHYTTLPKLEGVTVHAVAFSSGTDPDYVGRLKAQWRKVLLKTCLADSVGFFPVGVKYQLKLD
jgi:hypothetical protein